MHSGEPLPEGQYFDYTTQNNYAPNSPDTFYGQVNVLPPTASGSDSANTPPSPVASKSRRSVARPSNPNPQSQSSQSKHYSITDSFDLNTSRGPSTQVRKERERQLVNTPREALIQLAIKREYETKKAKQLLTAALLQIELANDKLAREEEARKALEAEKHTSSVKTTQAILTAQMESMNVHQEIGSYKLQVENLKREVKRLTDVLHNVENDRDEAERMVIRTRTKARQMQEQNVLLLAREEGRREGFEAGVRQGRLALPPGDLGNGTAEDQSSSKPRKRTSSKHRSRKPSTPPPPAPPSAAALEAEVAAAALREIDEREKIRIKKQLAAIAGELDAERQKSKNAERAAQRLVEERRKIEEDRRRLDEERDREKRARLHAEREKDEIQQREMARIKSLEQEKQRIQEAKDRELEELRRDRDRLAKEKMDAVSMAEKELRIERDRIKRLEDDREREYERERLREERDHEREKEKEKETSAAIAAATAAAIAAAVGAAKSSSSSYKQGSPPKPSPAESYQKIPYLPMPAPPTAPTTSSSNGGYSSVPRATSSTSQRGYGRDRTMSVGSYSSMLPIDMIQLPADSMRGGDLSAIVEDVSVRGASTARPATGGMPPPMWMTDDVWRAQGGTPISMPRAPADGPMQPPPVTMPRAPMDGMTYTAPGAMPRATGEGPASHQGMPVDMPRAPGEAPATYKPPPVMMPTAPGEGPSTYKPPPIMMPTAPGEGPATYQPPSAVTMPTAPGEAPATYQPPVSMPTAPGEAPSTYQPPANIPRAPGEGPGYQPPPSMPRAPGDGPGYRPPAVIPPAPGEAGNQGPITMPRAPGDGPGYQPPINMPRAPADGPGHTPPVTMPRAPADGPGQGYTPRSHTPGVSMPRSPADGPGYVPPEGSSYTPSISMPRAPADGPGYTPSVTMPRAPADGMGSAYTPRSHTPSIQMPRAPADGLGYVPPGVMSRPPTEGQGSAYTPRPHTPSIQMPRAPADGPGYIPPGAMSRPPTDGPGSAYTPRTMHARSISMPRTPGDGPGYTPPNAMSRPPTDSAGSAYTPRTRAKSISMPRAPADGPGYTPIVTMPGGAGSHEPPVIPGRTPSAGQRGFGDSAGYMPNNDLLSPHSSNRNGPVRRTSSGSNGSYEILIEPPSRPSSVAEERYQDTHSYLSPNHRPSPLPQVQPAHTRPRNTRGTDTEPNSPIQIAFEVPHNFVPQILTDRNGVSTPIAHSVVLPTARPTGISRPPSAQGIYGNPLNRNRGSDSPPGSPFIPPAVPFIPPAPADANRSPFIPPAALSGHPGMSSPNMGGWGVPGRAGSLGGGAGVNTPGSMSRDLPGTGQRTSIYGPPVSSFSPNVAPISMPVPSVFGNPNADEEDNGFDETTLNNTRMNTMVPPPVVVGKKKKKGKK